MGNAVITNAGKTYLAAKQAASEPAILNEFVFALIDGLDTDLTPPGTEPLPDIGDIKYTCAVTRAGFVTPDQVVYSVLLDSSIGDWSFNWIGLKSADGTLAAAIYVPETTKQKYDTLANQIGNNLTRNFLVVYDNLQTITEITVDAETWQIDFTQRLDASDDMQEQLAIIIAGANSIFIDDAFLIENDSGFKLRAGKSLVAGMAIDLLADIDASAEGAAASKDVWVDVWRSGDLNSVTVNVDVIADVAAAVHASYTDGNGIPHTVIKIASISAGGVVTDLRATSGNQVLDGPSLLDSLAKINGTYPLLRAQATTKADVGLGNLPNAKSDATNLNDSNTLATSKAVNDSRTTLQTAVDTHSARIDNPHATTKTQIGLGNLPNAKSDATNLNDSNTLATSKAVNDARALADGHAARTDNPHATTKSQIGLGNLPNAKSDATTLNDSNTLASSKAIYDLAQLLARSKIKPGTVHWFPTRALAVAALADGYIPGDGQIVNRADVPDLMAVAAYLPVVSEAVWTTTAAKHASYSQGDGSTTIRLPDYNGVNGADIALFLRGDGGNAAGEGNIQPSANKAHTHSESQPSASQSRGRGDGNTNLYVTYSTVQTGSSGGAEAVPENVAGVWCVKV